MDDINKPSDAPVTGDTGAPTGDTGAPVMGDSGMGGGMGDSIGGTMPPATDTGMGDTDGGMTPPPSGGSMPSDDTPASDAPTMGDTGMGGGMTPPTDDQPESGGM